MAQDLEAYIADAIEGFLVQETDFPFEIVLSDDHSGDRTLELCKEFQLGNPSAAFKILASDTRQGLEANFIKSMKAYEGTYIAFCDGDDYWTDPHKLQDQITFLDANPGCTLVCSDYDYGRPDGSVEISTYKLQHYGKRFSFFDDLSDAIATTLTVVVRKTALAPLLDRISPEAHPFIWDTVLWSYCLKDGWGYMLPRKTAIRRVLPTGAYSGKSRIEKLAIDEKCLVALKELMNKKPMEQFLEKKLYHCRLNMANELLGQGKTGDARKLFLTQVAATRAWRDLRPSARYSYYFARSFFPFLRHFDNSNVRTGRSE